MLGVSTVGMAERSELVSALAGARGGVSSGGGAAEAAQVQRRPASLPVLTPLPLFLGPEVSWTAALLDGADNLPLGVPGDEKVPNRWGGLKRWHRMINLLRGSGDAIEWRKQVEALIWLVEARAVPCPF